MPRRDGNVSGSRRRSGRNHAPMNSGRKGKQRSRKHLLRKLAMQARIEQHHATKRAERAASHKKGTTLTLAGASSGADVAPGRRLYLHI